VLTFRLIGAPRTTKRRVSNWSFVLLLAIPVAGFIPATPELRPFVDLTLAMVLGMPVLWLCQTMAPPLRYHALFTVGGRISYALYILHQPFRELAERISWRSGLLFEIRPVGGILILVTAVALAYVAERYYDRPLRRWFVARLKRGAAQSAVLRPASAS
jgi:peptidoglycan/LPS O-acetylase OafA/YrhL